MDSEAAAPSELAGGEPNSPSDLHSSLAAVDLDDCPFVLEEVAEEAVDGLVVEEAEEGDSSEEEAVAAAPPPPLTVAAASALHALLSDAAAVSRANREAWAAGAYDSAGRSPALTAGLNALLEVPTQPPRPAARLCTDPSLPAPHAQPGGRAEAGPAARAPSHPGEWRKAGRRAGVAVRQPGVLLCLPQ